MRASQRESRDASLPAPPHERVPGGGDEERARLFAVGLPEHVETALKEAAIEAFRSLKLRDYARVDMRLRRRTPAASTNVARLDAKSAAARQTAEEGWELFIIEVNPNPHLAQDSEFPMAARAAGYEYKQVIERMLESALAH